jgi:protein O-mannosyl-transferase
MATPSRTRVLIAGLGVVLAVCLAFSGVLENGFVNWDDDVYITGNSHLREFSVSNLEWMLTNTYPQWGPLALLVHAADVQLFGMEAAAHHVTSVALHAVAAVLVLALFLVVARLATPARSEAARLAGATTCALLFALHPLRVESVAWASEKKDLLCAIFSLAALLAWLSYAAGATARRRLLGLVAAHVCLALALMAKPMAVTLPLLLLVLDAYPLGRFSARALPRLLGEKLLLVAMAGAVAWLTLRPPSEPVPRMRVGRLESSARVLLPLRAATFHLEKTLWPYPLVPFYPAPPPERRRLDDPEFALSVVALAALTLAALWRWRCRAPCWIAAWAFYLVALLPVSGVVPLAGQLGADRFTYLPTLPVFALAGAGMARLWALGGGARRLGVAVAGALGLALGALTNLQVAVWRDSETFWSHVVNVFPGQVVMAYNNLGAVYHARALRTGRAEDLALAEAQYREAIALVPLHANAWNNLGLIHEQRGEWSEAGACYRRALEIAPQHPLATANLERLRSRRRMTRPEP